MSSLLNQLLGSPDLSNIDNKIDSIIQNLNSISDTSTSQETDFKNLDDITGDFLNLINTDNPNGSSNDQSIQQLDQLFQNVSIPNERLQRYRLYDELYQSVPLIKRILTVYISNIIPKNPVNDEIFIYNAKDLINNDKTNLVQSKQQYKSIVKQFNLATRMKKYILPNRLKYGDYFVEIVNVDETFKNTSVEKTLSNNSLSIINECSLIIDNINKPKVSNSNSISDGIYSRVSDLLIEYSDYDTDLKNILEIENENPKERNPDIVSIEEDKINYKNVLLRYHSPHNILILQTKYGTTLGYLEVTKDEQQGNINSSLSAMVQKVVTKDQTTQSQNTDKLIQFVLRNIFNKTYKDKKKQSINSIISSLDPEVFQFVKRLIIENDLNKTNNVAVSKLKVRFISPKYIVHFNNPDGSDYLPFASSVFDPLLLPGKLYMLTQLSNIITKLSRASVIRKWTLDMGPSKMSKQNINKLKREIYNTRVTLNDLGSFKSISKILSDFRDMFAIQQNGRTPVDMSIETTGDPNIKTEDLRDLRNELVSLSGVNNIAPLYSNVYRIIL